MTGNPPTVRLRVGVAKMGHAWVGAVHGIAKVVARVRSSSARVWWMSKAILSVEEEGASVGNVRLEKSVETTAVSVSHKNAVSIAIMGVLLETLTSLPSTGWLMTFRLLGSLSWWSRRTRRIP